MIKRFNAGEKPAELAKRYQVSIRTIYKIIKEYKETGYVPTEQKVGRKKTSLSESQKQLIQSAYYECDLGADGLETYIEVKYHIHLPHNKIHTYLLSIGAASEEPRKKRQRTYCRYQRTHSMTLWHTDWKEFRINGKKQYLTIFIDDRSRFITCYGIFDEATTENTLKVLKQGIAAYGCPDQIITDNGTQYCSARTDNPMVHEFGQFLHDNRIKHLRSRVGHPQTNGKAERFFKEFDSRLERFETIDNIVLWQNTIKPHRSLGGRTPEDVFWHAQAPERIFEYVNSWFWDF